MEFYKAKYLKNNVPAGRAYTFKSEKILLPGDKAETADGKHVQIVDEPVDMEWVKTYGAEKVAVLKKYVEPDSLKIGDKVVMNSKYHVSDSNNGKVFTVMAEPQEVCGTLSVWLEGYSGCYAVDGLSRYGEPVAAESEE